MAVVALLVSVVGVTLGSAEAAPAGAENTDGKIVFVSWLQVYTMDLDGSEPELILPQDGPDFGSEPEWSPGGTQVAVTYDNEIHVMNADGSNRHRVSPEGESAKSPSWSPDGNRIAWASSGRIKVANADGSNLTTIDRPTSPDFNLRWSGPHFSPDGSKFVASVIKVGIIPSENRIATVPVSGGEPSYLTAGPHDLRPQWSPDGTEIAFQTSDELGGNYEVWVMSSGGGGAHSITTGSRSFRISDWAGSGAIFATEEIPIPDSSTHENHVYRMNPDGTDLTLITDRGDNSGAADWVSTACSQHPFSDVPPWVDAAVDWSYCGQYLSGYPGGTFRGELPITRAQVARFLYKVAGSPDMSGEPDPPWPDVPAWIDDAAKWIAMNDYMDGYPDGTFGPNRSITRGQVIRLVWRIAGEPSGPPNPFSDVPAWIADAVDWGANDPDGDGPDTALVGGYPDNTFRDRNDITRHQTVRMVCRANTDPGTC